MNSKEATRKIVENYIQYFAEPVKDPGVLKSLLSDDLKFHSPLGEFANAQSFINDLNRNVLEIRNLKVRQIIADDNSACALYEIQSFNPDIGNLVFSEWFEVQGGKITSIKSTYDASDIRKTLAQI